MRYIANSKIRDIKGVETESAYGDFIVNVLLNGFDQKTSGEEKTKAFQLALKVQSAVEWNRLLDLSIDDVSRIKKAAEPVATVLAFGRLSEFLEHPEPDEQPI